MSPYQRKSRTFILCGVALFLVLTLSLASGSWSTILAAPSSSHLASQHTVAPDNTAVTTYKEDNGHTGNQTAETILNTSNVNQNTFGKHVSYPVDGQIYAQPLFLPNVTVGGTSYNVAYVATENDSVYAFDADQTAATAPLWHTNFLNAPSVVSPTNSDVSCNDMVPLNGLSGTPVIDRAAGILYVVVLTKENGTSFVYRLHALNVTTGQEEPGSPIQIQATVPGTGAASSNGQITFNPQRERQRAGLLLANGKVYIGWGSFCDDDPYHGWIMSYSYDGSQLHQVNVYNTTPNEARGGVWAAGGALVADSAGYIYSISGNGGFDASKQNYGDSFVKLNGQLQVQDYFAPFNQQCLYAEDADLGSGGPLLVPGQNRILGGGKEGRIYVIDTNNMGKYTTIANPCSNQKLTNVDKVVQEFPPATTGGLYSSSAYWKNASGQQYVYFTGANDHGKGFAMAANGTLSSSFFSETPQTFGFTGGNPTVSSNNGAAGTGIVWTLDPTPALRAYDATNLNTLLYSSTWNGPRDGLATYTKFTAPTVANGEVFVGTKGSLDIFGLVTPSGPTPTPTPPTPTPPTTPYNNIGVSHDNATTSANYDGQGNSYLASIALQNGKTVQSVTLPTTVHGGQLHVFAIATSSLTAPLYNNVGVTNDGASGSGNYDNQGGASYSAQALQSVGLVAGDNAFDPTRTVVFTWPNVPAGTADNYQCTGQVVPVTPLPNATTLAFLGSATNGPASGIATITYSDGSTQTFTLGFSDWTLGGGTVKTPSFGNGIAYASPYRNNPGVRFGLETVKTYVFYASVPLQAGKTIVSVTLPSAVSGGHLHVFAVTTA